MPPVSSVIILAEKPHILDFAEARRRDLHNVDEFLRQNGEDAATTLIVLIPDWKGLTITHQGLTLSPRQQIARRFSPEEALLQWIQAQPDDTPVFARFSTDALCFAPNVAADDFEIVDHLIDTEDEDVEAQLHRLQDNFSQAVDDEQKILEPLRALHTWTHDVIAAITAMFMLVRDEKASITNVINSLSSHLTKDLDEDVRVDVLEELEKLSFLASRATELNDATFREQSAATMQRIDAELNQAEQAYDLDCKHVNAIQYAITHQEFTQEKLISLNVAVSRDQLQVQLSNVKKALSELQESVMPLVRDAVTWLQHSMLQLNTALSMSQQIVAAEQQALQDQATQENLEEAMDQSLDQASEQPVEESPTSAPEMERASPLMGEMSSVVLVDAFEGAALEVVEHMPSSPNTPVGTKTTEEQGDHDVTDSSAGEDFELAQDKAEESIVSPALHMADSSALIPPTSKEDVVEKSSTNSKDDGATSEDKNQRELSTEETEDAYVVSMDAATAKSPPQKAKEITDTSDEDLDSGITALPHIPQYPADQRELQEQAQQQAQSQQQQQQSKTPPPLAMFTSLTSSLIHKPEEWLLLKKEKQAFQQKLEKQVALVTDLQKKLRLATNDNDHLKHQLAELQKMPKSSSQAGKASPNKLASDMKKLESELHNTSDALRHLKALYADLERERENCKAELAKQAVSFETQCIQLSQERDDLSSQVAITTARATQAEQEIVALRAELAQLRATVEEQESAVVQAQQQQQQSAEVEQLKLEVLKLRQETEYVRQENAKVVQECERNREMASSKQQQLEQLQATTHALSQEKQQLQDALDQARKGVAELQSSLRAREVEIQEVHQANDTLLRTSEDLQAEMERLKTKVHDFERSSADVVTLTRPEYIRLDQAAKASDTMLAEAQEAQQHVTELSEENASLRARLTVYVQEASEMAQKLRQQDDTIKLFQERTSMLEEQLHLQQGGHNTGLPPGKLALAVSGEAKIGDVILIERQANNQWARQSDPSMVVLEEYVAMIGLNRPDAPSPCPVLLLMIHDLGSTKGIEVTQYLREI
eukprot:m.127098 g.127098  ORF g.127098 m.127098 type:complete len:1057 (-) comp15647_c0_seq1:2040-5210(-)